MNYKIWLSPPHMSGEEIKFVDEAFESNWIAPVGPNIDGFEQDLKDYINIGGVVALSSGTAAIHLALVILDVKRDDLVLCSSFTFAASVNPITYLMATPILIDCEPETWNMDPELLEKAIKELQVKGKKPKAILLVHLYGMPAKLDDIFSIATKYDIPVIEDVAESLGSRYKGIHLGTFGRIGILSFNGNKIITTSGGGALISNDMDVISKAKFLSTQARDDMPYYQHTEIGYNYRMSNVIAGIGRGQMVVLEQRINARRKINGLYRQYLKGVTGITFQDEPLHHYSNYWLTTILVDPDLTGGIGREEVRLALEKNQIEARPLWKPMHLQPVYRDAPSYLNGNSEQMFEYGLCLPSGSNLSEQEILQIVEIVSDTIELPHKKRKISPVENLESVPFSPPRIDSKVLRSVEKTLMSGWITTGPKTREFEEKLTQYCGNKETLCVSSATSGLELVLKWFGVCVGDEVIIPAYTYCATGNVVLKCGATPVFVDIKYEDMLMDLDSVEARITEKTKIIMPVDFAGMPCDYDKLMELVNRDDIRRKFRGSTDIQNKLGRIMVLSDAAHALGAVYRNRKTGTLADITVFSFHAVKNLTTAEGGAIALNLPASFDIGEVYNFMRTYSLHGQTKDALVKSVEIGWQYDVVEPGMKANMTDILASMGLVEIERYEHDTLVKLKRIFNTYDTLLSRHEWAELPTYSNAEKESAYHIYPLRIKDINEGQRDLIIHHCQQNGVMVNVHFIPLPMFTAYAKAGFSIKEVPVSYEVYSREISLPVFYDITDRQVERVVSVLADAIKRVMHY